MWEAGPCTSRVRSLRRHVPTCSCRGGRAPQVEARSCHTHPNTSISSRCRSCPSVAGGASARCCTSGRPPGSILELAIARMPAADAARAGRAAIARARGTRARRARAASRSCRGATPRIRPRSPRSPIRRRCCGRAGTSRRSTRPAVAIVGSRAGLAVRLERRGAPRRRSRRARPRRRQRPGARRGFGGASRRAGGGDGSTLAVLGSGADVVYPAEHRDLARRIEADGAVRQRARAGHAAAQAVLSAAQSRSSAGSRAPC